MRVTRVAHRTMAENVAALRRGEVDVVQVFEPFAATLLGDAAGHVCYAQANRGPTWYTAFYARRGRREGLHRIVRGLLASLVSGGFVSPGTAYDVAVDNSLANAVIAEAADVNGERGDATRDG